jgi:hypothetical protein
VTVNNQRIWSKHDTGTFPRESDIVDAIRKLT